MVICNRNTGSANTTPSASILPIAKADIFRDRKTLSLDARIEGQSQATTHASHWPTDNDENTRPQAASEGHIPPVPKAQPMARITTVAPFTTQTAMANMPPFIANEAQDANPLVAVGVNVKQAPINRRLYNPKLVQSAYASPINYTYGPAAPPIGSYSDLNTKQIAYGSHVPAMKRARLTPKSHR
jgi:hypothetical protein